MLSPTLCGLFIVAPEFCDTSINNINALVSRFLYYIFFCMNSM